MPNQQPKKPNYKSRPLVLALQAALLAGVALPSMSAWCAETTRVSVAGDGTQGNHWSNTPSISADGRFVAFRSSASNLVAGDANGAGGIFVRDRAAGTTTRVSVADDGTQGNSYSTYPSISADGRFVAFRSSADNLVVGDTNGTWDIFVRDRAAGTTTWVSVAGDETQGNGESFAPSLSADGRFVAFRSHASNLVADDTNGSSDIFVRDRTAGTTSRVSVADGGAQGYSGSYGAPSISADGRFVAFVSGADNLVVGDTNGSSDIFVRDRAAGTTSRVSVAGGGAQGNSSSYGAPSISADGRFVAFRSSATNLVAGDTNGSYDTFVRDRTAGTTSRVSVAGGGAQGNGHSYGAPSLSADGRFVAFGSHADNLVAGDTNASPDIFVRDRLLRPAVTADLRVSQTVSANPVTRGGVFSYTATVTNLGPARADNVALTNLGALPFGRASLPTFTPSQGTCRRGAISICRLGALNAGQQATVQVNLTARTTGTVRNRVSVNAAPRDLTPLNNSVTTVTTISR